MREASSTPQPICPQSACRTRRKSRSRRSLPDPCRDDSAWVSSEMDAGARAARDVCSNQVALPQSGAQRALEAGPKGSFPGRHAEREQCLRPRSVRTSRPRGVRDPDRLRVQQGATPSSPRKARAHAHDAGCATGDIADTFAQGTGNRRSLPQSRSRCRGEKVRGEVCLIHASQAVEPPAVARPRRLI
jgi:hypothetical protein